MKAICSYCNQRFELNDSDFLILYKTQRKVYCQKCKNKKTMGCYECVKFTRFYDYDYCSEWSYGIPSYCDKFIKKEVEEKKKTKLRLK